MSKHLMEEVFQKIIDRDFSDLAGLTANASIPVSGSLINEMITAVLAGDKTIESCQVSIYEQNRVSVRLKTSLLPWPLNLKLKLDSSVDFESFSSPKVRAWLENHRALGSLASFFHALPKWLKLYGDQVVVDLGVFLRTREQKEIFDLIRSVGIETEVDKVIFDVKIRVAEQ